MPYIEAILNKRTGGIVKYDEDVTTPVILDSLPVIRVDDLHIKKATPSAILEGVETGAKKFTIKEDTGKCVIRNESDGVDEVTIDPAGRVIISRNLTAGGVALDAHAARHQAGGADALPAGSIDRSQIKPLGILWVKSASPTPGTGGAYGTAVALKPIVNKSIVPLSAKLSWGGTFATEETVTIRLTAKFSDNTTASITKSATATGDVYLNPADLQGLMKDGVYITEIDVDSSSSAASTTVTTSATVYGIEI
jgi:hypothetical protein